MTAIALVVLGAAIVGLVTNWLVHPRLVAELNEDSVDIGKAESWGWAVLGPSVTLLALFLAFVLSGAAASRSEAQSAASKEVAVVNDLYGTADFVNEPFRRQLKAATICYARAVAGPDWRAMADGEGGSSPIPDIWTGVGRDGLRHTIAALGTSDSMFSTLTTANRNRADSRRTRLTRASPSVPAIVIAFLVAVIALVVMFHAVTSPPKSVQHMFATVVAVGTMLAGLSLIQTFDRPFTGALEIKPTQMQDSARDLSAGFAKVYQRTGVPCDRDGQPTRAQT